MRYYANFNLNLNTAGILTRGLGQFDGINEKRHIKVIYNLHRETRRAYTAPFK